MNSPKKYTKKPVTIEAMKWDGAAEGSVPIIEWMLEYEASASFWCDNPDDCSQGEDGEDEYPHTIIIRTLEGNMHAGPGDYVIKGVQGEFYPCKPEIFAATYEEEKQ